MDELPGSRETAVCFADLVGFTRLGEEVPPEELTQLAARLEQLAADVIEPPVRLVKTIGDAVMLASPEAEPLLDGGLALLEAAAAEGSRFPVCGRASPSAPPSAGRGTGSGDRSTSPAASPRSRGPGACWPSGACASSHRTPTAGPTPASGG